MISGMGVRGAKCLDIKHVALSFIIFFACFPQAASVCIASDRTGADAPSAWLAADDAELEELRGGFMLDNGMVVDLSFATTVFINNQEQFSDRYSLANDFSLGQLRAAAVNSGSNNWVTPDAARGNIAVVQNTLDNQIIGILRSVDITLSNIKRVDMSGFAP